MTSIIEKESVSSRNISTSTFQTRLAWVDYARGLAILLVVYRHTMVGLERSGIGVSPFLYGIQEFLVNVRMPVFFVLSGIFLGQTLRYKPAGTLIKKKLYTLLYPYLVWTIILISFQIILSDYTNSKRTVADYMYIVTQPRELDHMWYLIALFNASMLLLLGSRWLFKRPLLHLGIAFIVHFLHYWVSEYSLLSDLFYYYIFLCVGVHVSAYVLEYDKKGNSFLVRLLLYIAPVFIIGQLFWLNHIDDNYKPLEIWYLLPFLFIIFVACVMFYCVCRLLYNAGIVKVLNMIGKSSLYIYILHILVISSFRIVCTKVLHVSNSYFLIAGSLVLGICIPVLIYKLADKWPGIHFLFSLDKRQKR